MSFEENMNQKTTDTIVVALFDAFLHAQAVVVRDPLGDDLGQFADKPVDKKETRRRIRRLLTTAKEVGDLRREEAYAEWERGEISGNEFEDIRDAADEMVWYLEESLKDF
jgi:hypothetical protein